MSNFLLGHGKSHSNIYFTNHHNLPRSSNDRDVSHEHTRRKETQKYLKESYYHCIKCIAATFLTTFMWRRPLNSAILATTTHKKPEKVSNETYTQVRAQIINKCRIKMVQRELYNVRNPQWEGDRRRERKNTVAIIIVFITGLIDLYYNWPPQTMLWSRPSSLSHSL